MPKRKTVVSATSKATGRDVGTGKVLTLIKTHPPQLSLFQTFVPEDSDHYSNTIELYDAIPRYFSSKKLMAELRQGGVFLKSLKRRFKHKDQWYELIIKPARLVDKDGNEKEYYPTHQEELVEEALKKIACDRLKGVFLDDTAGVQFTLYELDRELKSQGHAMKWPDLIRSLEICRSAGIEVIGPEGKAEVKSSIFPVVALVNRDEWRKNPGQVRCYVQFNPLLTYSIKALTYRQFDYRTFMRLKNHLARWLFKRLSHNYTQAAWDRPYTIRLSTIVRDSALVNASRTSDKARYIDAALDELAKIPAVDTNAIRVLMKYEKEEIRGPKNKIEDVKYTLVPDFDFTAQMKRANLRQQKITQAAVELQTLDVSDNEVKPPTITRKSAY